MRYASPRSGSTASPDAVLNDAIGATRAAGGVAHAEACLQAMFAGASVRLRNHGARTLAEAHGPPAHRLWEMIQRIPTPVIQPNAAHPSIRVDALADGSPSVRAEIAAALHDLPVVREAFAAVVADHASPDRSVRILALCAGPSAAPRLDEVRADALDAPAVRALVAAHGLDVWNKPVSWPGAAPWAHPGAMPRLLCAALFVCRDTDAIRELIAADPVGCSAGEVIDATNRSPAMWVAARMRCAAPNDAVLAAIWAGGIDPFAANLADPFVASQHVDQADLVARWLRSAADGPDGGPAPWFQTACATITACMAGNHREAATIVRDAIDPDGLVGFLCARMADRVPAWAGVCAAALSAAVVSQELPPNLTPTTALAMVARWNRA